MIFKKTYMGSKNLSATFIFKSPALFYCFAAAEFNGPRSKSAKVEISDITLGLSRSLSFSLCLEENLSKRRLVFRAKSVFRLNWKLLRSHPYNFPYESPYDLLQSSTPVRIAVRFPTRFPVRIIIIQGKNDFPEIGRQKLNRVPFCALEPIGCFAGRGKLNCAQCKIGDDSSRMGNLMPTKSFWNSYGDSYRNSYV
jgi:hypothetical protein